MPLPYDRKSVERLLTQSFGKLHPQNVNYHKANPQIAEARCHLSISHGKRCFEK